jgi:CPA1 family monovalent cation:H+ antiporter
MFEQTTFIPYLKTHRVNDNHSGGLSTKKSVNMLAMHSFELILALLTAVLVSSVIGQRIPKISLPLIQVALGVAMVILPIPFDGGTLDPELFFVIFIAPMLFEEAKKADKPSLWRLRRPILSLAIGLVVATCVAVGLVMHWMVPTIPLAAGLAMAAALAPTDAVAVFSLQAVSTITDEQDNLLRGEALFNDAASIVSFQFAVTAVLTSSFSALNAGVSFLVMFFGGLLLGITVMGVRYLIMRVVTASGLELTTFFVLFEIITPSLVYLIAELLHVSGIIAVVAAGVVYSYSPRGNTPVSARNSLVSSSVWALVVFIINGLCFIILGAELPFIVARIQAADMVDIGFLFVCMLAMLAVILLVRFLWILYMHRHVNLAGGAMAMVGETLGSEAVQAVDDDDLDDEDPENQPFTIRFDTGTPGQIAHTRMERWYAFRNMRKDRKEARREAIRIERLQAHSDLDYWKLHLRDALLLAVGGPKGAITLALVFTIPLLAADGVDFPERDIITFVASGTIMLSLLFTSFSMPVLSPKKPVELAQEEELDTMADILRSVAQQILDSAIVDDPGDRMIIDSVTRQYYQRIRRLREQSNIDNPEDTRLQILMVEWEREYILNSVVKGRLGFWSALFALNQLARQHARMLHRSPIFPMFRAFGNQIKSHFECWKLGRDSSVEQGSHFEQQPRLRMPDLQIGIRENSLLKLEQLLERNAASDAAGLENSIDAGDADAIVESSETSSETVAVREYDFSEQRITQMITTIRRQLDRLNHAVSARQIIAVSARAQMTRATPVVQAELERKEIRLSMQALEWEREAITRALRAERISAKTARQMLDNVAIMELDIEELLQ